MWDRHWCRGATGRVATSAKMARPLLARARSRGALIGHAPSDTMEFYRDAPQRLAIRSLPMHAILIRDLTCAMYDPKAAPYVSHEAGTELVIQYREKYWCPSVPSSDLLKALAAGS